MKLVDIRIWRGYALDISRVVAVSPISALRYVIHMQGGTCLSMNFVAMDDAREDRAKFVNQWVAATTEAQYNNRLHQT